MTEHRSENLCISAVSNFDEAVKAYLTSFGSDEAALNFLLVHQKSEQVVTLLKLIGDRRGVDLDRMPPWDRIEVSTTKTILLSVFKNLEVSDLKSLRLVSKLFCQLVTPLMDTKTALRHFGKEKISTKSQGYRVQHFGIRLSDIIPLTPSWTWRTHQFRHVELDVREHHLWVTPNATKTFESLFLNPCMFTVETLRIHGFRFDLFDIELETSIPACLAKFWQNLKAIAFLDPRSYRHHADQVYLTQQPVILTAEDQIHQLEEIHFEVHSKQSMDWRFLELCPKLKVIKIDAYHSTEYTLNPHVIPPMTRCLELILPRLKQKKIERLQLTFGIRDETDVIADFVQAVAAKHNLKDVVYKISTSKQECLNFIRSVPLPLNSAVFTFGVEASKHFLGILIDLHHKGYFHLDAFEVECEQFAIRKLHRAVVIEENVENTSASLALLLPIWFPNFEIKYIQPPGLQCENENCPMELDSTDLKLESNNIGNLLEASNEFRRAVCCYISNFSSTEVAVNLLLRMKESMWPHVTTFIYTCWGSKLYDGEDWRINPCVLEAICRRSDIMTLKSMRLVCKTWSNVATIWLARTSIVTLETSRSDKVRRSRERGLRIDTPLGRLHPLLDPGRAWNIQLNNLEIQTSRYMWNQRDFTLLIKTLFMNPATANLESLRILKFSTNVVDQQILPYFIPKYLKKLKSLTLVSPFSTEEHQFDQKPLETFMPLERLVVQIIDDWQPRWSFLHFCPHLKSFKLIGREFVRDGGFYGFGHGNCANFAERLNDAWPFLKTKSIQKLGLKFGPNVDTIPIVDFVNKVATLGSLKDVSYEIDSSAVQICNLLKTLPLPSRQVKLVLINGFDSCGHSRADPQFTSFITSTLDNVASNGYMSKLERFDLGIVNRNRNRGPHVRDFSLIVTKNAVAFSCNNSDSPSDFSIMEDYRDRLASWFPEMNYFCCPWQLEDEKRSEVRTRILELFVPQGSAFYLPGMAGRSRSRVTEGLDLDESGFLFSLKQMEVFDAKIIHQHAVSVPRVLRSRDLHSTSCRMYVFSKAKLNEFLEARDGEEGGVQKMDTSNWNIPDNLVLLRTITSKRLH